MTRGFYHGRTETIRSQSNESLAMVSAFDDPSVSSATKAELFRAAAKYHRNYLMRCMSGQGSDRHLMGLKLLAMEAGLPLHPLYAHKAYTMSTDFELSTSQLPVSTL
jgi:carnitine O-acetyltransferase